MDVLHVSDEAPGSAFDYAQLDDAAALEARAAVERYRGRSRAYVMDTGRDLLAVKERLEHGLFLSWVEAEMGMTPRTAQNFMQAAAQLGHKSEIVSHLPPTILYKLAAPSTPAPLREEIVGRLEAGEAITPREIDTRLWAARAEARREAADAKVPPEERKRQQKLKREREARQKREREKSQREYEERQRRRTDATKELAELLAPLLDDASYRQALQLMRNCELYRLPDALASAYGLTEEDQAFHDRLFAKVDGEGGSDG